MVPVAQPRRRTDPVLAFDLHLFCRQYVHEMATV